MAEIRFECDLRKNTENRRKHGVSFEEAETVFSDEHALLIDDPDHSTTEDRFVLLGLSSRFRVLLVVHSYHEKDEVIRIISARRAIKAERARYDERWQR